MSDGTNVPRNVVDYGSMATSTTAPMTTTTSTTVNEQFTGSTRPSFLPWRRYFARRTPRNAVSAVRTDEDDDSIYDDGDNDDEYDNDFNERNNHWEQQQRRKHRPDHLTSATKLFALCAALNSVNVGYDIGVSTNAGPKIQKDFALTDSQLEMFLGSINFWSIGGALISPWLTDRYGRRTTFLVAAVGFVLGIGLLSLASNFTQLMIGRLIVGLGVGCGEAIDPMYISEIAPASHRGELVSWAEAGVALGVVLGFASSLIFYPMRENSNEWRYMLGLGVVMPLVMISLIFFEVMPESPRWLLAQVQQLKMAEENEHDTDNTDSCTDINVSSDMRRMKMECLTAEARNVLVRTHPVGYNVDRVVNDINASLEFDRAANRVVGWSFLLCHPPPSIRRMLLVGVGIAIIQQAVGIDSIMFYMVFVIQRSGVTSELGQLFALILLGTVKLAFVFVGAALFDRLGRRPLLFTSLLGMAMSLFVVSITIDVSNSPVASFCTVLFLAAYLAFFSTGLGPGNWVVVSEVFATSIRAKAMSVAVFPNRVTATICASSFLSLARAVSWPRFFQILATVCLLSCWFLYAYLPETKGQSLENMSHYFAQLTGDRSILDVEERLRAQRRDAARVETGRGQEDDDGELETNELSHGDSAIQSDRIS